MGLIQRIRGGNVNSIDNTLGGIIRIGGITYNAVWNFTRTLDSVYANPTAKRCVERLAADFQRPDWQVRKPDTEEDLTADQSPAIKSALGILNRPNPGMSGTTMQYHISRDLDLSGATFWLKLRGSLDDDVTSNNGALVGLRRLPPQRCTVIGNEDDELLGFIYQNRLGQQSAILPEELIYVHYPHPERACDRLAPALVAGLPAETDTAAMRFNFELLANDGGLPGYISVEGLSTDQFLQWKALWESGNAPGRTRFLGGGGKASYTRVGMTNQEMTYDKLRDASQEDICRSFGPAKVLIDPTDATFANMDIATRNHITSNVLPRWVMVGDAFSLQLGDDLGGFEVGFNLDTIDELSEALDSLVTRGIALLGADAITINELRKELGLDPVEWGDVPMSQMMGAAPQNAGNALNGASDASESAPIPTVDDIESGIKLFESIEAGPTVKMLESPKTKAKQTVTLDWFHRRVTPFEKASERAMKAFFERQSKALVARVKSKKGKAFKAADDWESIYDKSRWQDELSDVAKTMLSGPVDAIGSETLSTISPDADFEDHNDRIENYLIHRSTDIAGLVDDTTSEELRDVVAQVHTNGGGVDDVASAIKGYFDDNADMRAQRVARTEVLGAANWASLEGARQSGVVTQKQWLDSGADDECAELAAMEPIGLDEMFGDFDAPPAHPNCICSLSYVVDSGDDTEEE